MILQGEIYFIDPGEPFGSEPGFYRPWVVIQNDAMNRSGLNTVIVLPLTTNLQRVTGRGNVLVPAGQGGLRIDSVVQVHQPSTFDRARFGEPIGKLRPALIRAISAGVAGVVAPRGHAAD